MKKAVIAVVAVLVFIFTLTQKSEAVTAANWSELSDYLSGYSTDPIELSDNITSVGNFTLFTLTANKTITSNTSKSLSFIFSPLPPTTIRHFGFRQQKVDVSKA
jgi:hypothetical protein